jgi:hypothetical protein
MAEAPTLTATIALLGWPLVVVWLFSARPRNEALIWSILAGFLLLPVRAAIKFEGIPEFDKASIPSLACLFALLLAGWRPRVGNRLGLLQVLLIIYLLGPFITSLRNVDPIVLGDDSVLPALGAYDGFSAVVAQLIQLLPFFFARQLLAHADDREALLRALAIAGLVYSLPVLFEVRLSPQLHSWLYGIFPGPSFLAEMRYGGFRPVVFMRDGLVLAFFMLTAFVAAAGLWRARLKIAGLSSGLATAYLGCVLVLCKTAEVLVVGAGLFCLVRFVRPGLQMAAAVLVALSCLLYPLLRSADVVPTDALVQLAKSVDSERGHSLQVRFDQEEQLLARASERFWFGWGRFGRNRVHDANGKDISLTDGQWIITMGQYGFLGFLAEFGLLCVPVIRAAFALRFVAGPREAILLSSLTLILAANILDQLPNASLSPWTWLLAGALLGNAESLRAEAHRPVQAAASKQSRMQRAPAAIG